MTLSQSPREDWRNNRIDGYQGLSSPSSSQRQSGTSGNSVQTGLPSSCLEEPLESGLTYDDDSPAPLDHERQVTNELNGIPKALLGVEQNRASFQ